MRGVGLGLVRVSLGSGRGLGLGLLFVWRADLGGDLGRARLNVLLHCLGNSLDLGRSLGRQHGDALLDIARGDKEAAAHLQPYVVK